MIDIAAQRFYGAKSEPVDAIDVVAAEDVTSPTTGEHFTWQILAVHHGGTVDHYQVFVDATGTQDVLHTPEGAEAYLANVATFGAVEGTIDSAGARPLGAEQSNTSLVVGEHIVKVFRRLEDGLNPDVELLSQIADCPAVAAVRGYATRDGQTLAMQQDCIVGGTDGFVLATGGTLDTSDTEALGTAIRQVHTALAEAFPTETASPSSLRTRLTHHLDSYIQRAPVLEQYRERILKLYSLLDASSATTATTPLTTQRVHGDLHLGQTLKTDPQWFLIDFEGEPARPLQERRLPDHPLRDVAGMIRSYGYAAAVGGFDAAWEREHVEKLLEGYGTAPASEDPVLAAYVVDKAAYEVVYEANNRPDWVEIPLRAIETLV
ncbi:phosphotransferase [Corynebacterium pseudogenitalium]|uniref:phosphotransferase n=1 Tax=Corynebacterium pseudogenitalium TaxID=38303 RepID=UPI00210B52EE|nr:phosphotransferase [Corynebacterium pseudogenitalium]MCQ4607433.1 phosphotransferase [Corynebacterium pseudogenitalium]